jgi:hypothetical protein
MLVSNYAKSCVDNLIKLFSFMKLQTQNFLTALGAFELIAY